MKALIFLFVLFFISANMNAQKIGFQLGAKTMHEIHINSFMNFSDSTKLGLRISYYIAFAEELYMEQGGIIPVEFLIHGINQKGFGLGLFYKGKSRKTSKRWNQYTIEYQRLSSGNYIWDEGKFGGSSEESYQEFTDKYNNVSFIYSRHIDLGSNNRWELVWEYGATLKIIERSYSIDGTYSSKTPSDKIEHLISGAPVFRFGFNYKI